MGLKVTVIEDFNITCRILEVTSIDNDFIGYWRFYTFREFSDGIFE